MKNATVLYHTDLETSDEDIRASARAAAQQDIHLGVMLHALMPTMPISVYGGFPSYVPSLPDGWPEQLRENQALLKDRAQAIEAILADENCSGDVRPFLSAEPEIQTDVATSARTADWSVLASNLRETPDVMHEIVHGVLFRSPIGLMLNAPVGPAPVHVMVAWDESPAAARAVHLALPFLKSAQDVTIACFDPSPLSEGRPYEPGAAASSWLSHHGCQVTIAQYPSGGKEIATCLLERALELGSDLLVMGAYSHSRIRQAVFGGTTRSMIEQTQQAVFLAH